MKRETWSIEEFLQEVPCVPGCNITSKQVLNYGVSNYLYYLDEKDETDYLEYLQVLEEAGFKI